MNNSEREVLKLFFSDMCNFSSQKGFIKFAYQSRTHWMLTCLIGASSPKGISFEKICEKIDRNLSSRSTIQSILDNMVKQFFLKKLTSSKDKRVQLYHFTAEANNAINLWIKRQKQIFKSNEV